MYTAALYNSIEIYIHTRSSERGSWANGDADRNNEVEIHFIPSHTGKITQNEEIDKLAKNAAELADDEIDHDPFTSSYRLMLQKTAKNETDQLLASPRAPHAWHHRHKHWPDPG